MGRYGLIVARIRPGSEAAVARIFAESDTTELPGLARVRHRSLFKMNDGLYCHLVESDGDFEKSVSGVASHPLFREISTQLAAHISPYDPATWRSPKDAFATEFYCWDAPRET